MELDDLARTLDTSGATVLIDGRSGAGKSTLATHLGLLRPDALIVRLDDIYPGWDGLAWASEHLRREVLIPRAAGGRSRWRGWDWAADRPGEWHEVPVSRPLIVEGVGALTAASRSMADLGVWVDAEDELRRTRALTRDGETYAPHWQRWAEQETAHIAQHRPETSADVIAHAGENGFTFESADQHTTVSGGAAS